jgi:hypothetical protein
MEMGHDGASTEEAAWVLQGKGSYSPSSTSYFPILDASGLETFGA